MNGVGSLISKEDDLALGPGLITQELLCSRVLSKYEKRQRKLLTPTSEEGQRVPPLVSLSKGAVYFLNWLLQYIKRMSQGCKDLTRTTPTIYILRRED